MCNAWGFTPSRSTTTALLSLFHNSLRQAENGMNIGLVFFHLLRAFDSVPHQPLLEKFLSLVPLTSSSGLVLYADDILLCKPIYVTFPNTSKALRKFSDSVL